MKTREYVTTFRYESVLKPVSAFLSHLHLEYKKLIASHNHAFVLEIRRENADDDRLVDFVRGSLSFNVHGGCGRQTQKGFKTSLTQPLEQMSK